MSDRSKSSSLPSTYAGRRGDASASGHAALAPTVTRSQVGMTELILSQWRAEKPEIEGLGFEIGTLLTRLSILLNQFEVRTAQGLGLRSGEIRLLYALRRVGPPYAQRPTDLFRLLGVTSGAITYTVNLLKGRDLVEGFSDPQDGRSQMVRLTPAGLALIDALVAETAGLLNTALRPLAVREQTTIQQGLARLAECLEVFTDHRVDSLRSEIEDKAV